METEGPGNLMRTFVGGSDRWGRQASYTAIVEATRKAGLSGATVFKFKGIEGYGGHSVVHAARVFDLSSDLRVLIEIVEGEDRFIPRLDEMVKEGLGTLETVEIIAYRAGSLKA
jgi:PII-like signaling protein